MLTFVPVRRFSFFFFFNDTATTEIYTLSLHDALPICFAAMAFAILRGTGVLELFEVGEQERQGSLDALVEAIVQAGTRSEEHTSELQSQSNLVCRLLLEKKNTNTSLCDRVNRCHTLVHTCSQ